MNARPIIARPALAGILCAVGASLVFSINDVSIKFLSGDYALHQIVLTRALVGMVVLLCVILPFQGGGLRSLRTDKLHIHLFRGLCVVCSNLCYFLGLAALPLADAVALFFIAPLLITALSVVMLGEKVGPRRWAAVGVGLLGVVIMTRPGEGTFQPASVLPVIAALAYAMMHMMTRRMGGTESAITMTFYVQACFVLVSAGFGLIAGGGDFAGQTDPSLAFLFRAWIWPEPFDWVIMVIIGMSSTIGGLLIAQAYKLSEAALVAPFEYASMPLAVIWGVTVFQTWPDTVAWIGIALICGAGLYVFWREAHLARRERRLK